MATRKKLAMAAFTERLTENQQKLVREHLLHTALEEAEAEINRKTKYRIMPHHQFAAGNADPDVSIYQAVFWAHTKLRHLWEVNEDGKTVMCDYSKL